MLAAAHNGDCADRHRRPYAPLALVRINKSDWRAFLPLHPVGRGVGQAEGVFPRGHLLAHVGACGQDSHAIGDQVIHQPARKGLAPHHHQRRHPTYRRAVVKPGNGHFPLPPGIGQLKHRTGDVGSRHKLRVIQDHPRPSGKADPHSFVVLILRRQPGGGWRDIGIEEALTRQKLGLAACPGDEDVGHRLRFFGQKPLAQFSRALHNQVHPHPGGGLERLHHRADGRFAPPRIDDQRLPAQVPGRCSGGRWGAEEEREAAGEKHRHHEPADSGPLSGLPCVACSLNPVH
jgi:hypothetical protein